MQCKLLKAFVKRPLQMAEKPSTPLGIPEAEFIDDIVAAVPDIQTAQKIFEEKSQLLMKYRTLEDTLNIKQQKLKESRPDIIGNLNAAKKVASLKSSVKTHFQIAESLYGTAEIDKSSTVALWLGANLMVEYPVDDAIAILDEQLKTLEAQIAENENNLIFLRNQIITTEVTTSRVTNRIIQLQQQSRK